METRGATAGQGQKKQTGGGNGGGLEKFGRGLGQVSIIDGFSRWADGAFAGKDLGGEIAAVSYTHLTLPTIYSV